MNGHLSDDFYNPVPCGLGELEADFEVVANSLCREQEKRTMCELEFPFGIFS